VRSNLDPDGDRGVGRYLARIRLQELSLSHSALLESYSVLRRAIWPFSRGVPRATFIGR